MQKNGGTEVIWLGTELEFLATCRKWGGGEEKGYSRYLQTLKCCPEEEFSRVMVMSS